MIELDQFKAQLHDTTVSFRELGDSIDPAGLQKKIDRFEEIMAAPDFWNDAKEAGKITTEANTLKRRLKKWQDLENAYQDIEVLLEIGYEEEDESVLPELADTMKQYLEQLEEMRTQTLLSGEYDKDNAIVSLHAGAGGTESCDWVSMLYRMYTHYADRQGFQTELLDFLDGEEAGLKMVTFEVTGENAYGLLKSEKGIHRLVRISPFNAAGKRQTSFAACDVMPEIDDTIDFEISDDEIKIDTYRSSGAGGQKVNKTSSAIRITHLPTGIVVQCQNERSQYQNKDKAMQMLKSKLYLMKQEEQAEKAAGIRGDVRHIEFGSQIRSYVMHPYTLVKDHRTGEETGNINAVMDGDLTPFINAYLKYSVRGKADE